MYCSHFVTLLIGTIVSFVLNFYYLLFSKNYEIRFLNPIILPIANIMLLPVIPSILFVKVEGNVFAFSIAFLFIPWILIFLSALIIYFLNLFDFNKNINNKK